MQFNSFRSTFFLMLAFVASPALARSQTYKTWSEDSLYERGAILMQVGQRLEKSIAMASELVERKPSNAKYQMLLGCACAARLESFACATANAKNEEGCRRLFQKRLKIWQQMQSNPAMPLYGKPQPTNPDAPATPDDHEEFHADDKNAQKRRTELAPLALRHLRLAYLLSRKLAPERRAEISYACGWGLLLLYHSAKDDIEFYETPPQVSSVSAAPKQSPEKDLALTHDEIIACFQDCVDCDKQRVDYWQSLAYANAPDCLVNPAMAGEEDKIAGAKPLRIAATLDALHHALKIKRNDPNSLYELAILAHFSPTNDTLDSLKKLTAIESQNAVYFYQLAAACLEKADSLKGDAASQMQADALTALEAGSAAPQYKDTPLFFPAPKLLKAAWLYRRNYGMGRNYYYFGTIFSGLQQAANRSADAKLNNAAMRIGVAMTELALNLAGHFDAQSNEWNDLIDQSIFYSRGFFVLIYGPSAYKIIRSAAEAEPNEANTAILNRYAPLKSYWKAWDDAIISR